MRIYKKPRTEYFRFLGICVVHMKLNFIRHNKFLLGIYKLNILKEMNCHTAKSTFLSNKLKAEEHLLKCIKATDCIYKGNYCILFIQRIYKLHYAVILFIKIGTDFAIHILVYRH